VNGADLPDEIARLAARERRSRLRLLLSLLLFLAVFFVLLFSEPIP